MQHVNQYEITLETGERKIVNDTELKKGNLYYTEIGPGFGMEAIVGIRLLPHQRILDEGGIRAPKSQGE
ncbi:MAG: hypothetical protein OXM61_17295 [Candidatus Poribacteria bacterium]|nr:hypothetical protein [Candidatus Poribacteria bacterium]